MVRRFLSQPSPDESRTSPGVFEARPNSFHLASMLWVAAITLLMVPMTTLIDVPVARWIQSNPAPVWFENALDFSVYYSQGTGVFFALVLIIAFAPGRRWCVPRLATLAMGAGAVATLTKLFVLRPRPGSLYLDATNYEYAWIWDFDFTLSQVAAFDPATRAFPSASLATATALTAGLWVIAPRARWICCLFCLGTMGQRAFCGAHFTSDLFGSASVGLAWAYACFHPSLMGALFDKIEPESTDVLQNTPDSSLEGQTTITFELDDDEDASATDANVSKDSSDHRAA